MLSALEIRDMLIIERLDLSFQPGLNVLTGETGAGKSILLDALGFVLGWRGRADLVRSGANQGEVVAAFELPGNHPAWAVLDAAGLPAGEDLILRRVNSRDGRKTAYVNDRRVGGEVLRRLSDVLVELHGQHDDRGLLNERGHRHLLDEFGDHGSALQRCRDAWRDLRTAEAALDKAQVEATAARADEDYLRHAVAELSELDPKAAEADELDARRRMMRAADRLRDDIAKAGAALGPQAAEGMLHDARRWLEGGEADLGQAVESPLAALSRALAELGEAQDGVARLADAMAIDPGELERVEDRLFAIRGLARKHGVAPDDLADLTRSLSQKLAALDASSADIAALEKAASEARAVYEAAAADLTSERVAAAERLDAAMAAELEPLKMERARFSTSLTPTDAGPDGKDAIAFVVSTNPGAPAGPLNKIASGGELSRFLLALKVCLTRRQAGLTLIFDEIDRGVGGATADAVGRRLADLAKMSQVLVVTHSPQVAALGDHHWRVRKHVTDDRTVSEVEPLDEAARVDEIARMLAGDTVTEEARGAARVLLDG